MDVSAQDISILIVCNEQELCQLLSMKIDRMGYGSLGVEGSDACFEKLSTVDNIRTVILDISMQNIDGILVLEGIQKNYPNLPVIILASSTLLDSARRAIDMGAFDYLIKPFDIGRINVVISNALSFYMLKHEVGDLRGKIRRNKFYKNIVGESEKINEIFQQADRIIGKDVSVLILGESGTGKELLAKAIHQASARKNGPFVIVNCAAITQELADSLLFGHKKGSFTGALTDHVGYFESANHGTIFLDEIGDMNIDIQAKVLRVIEEKKVRRVGEKVERDISFRIISATNRDLVGGIRIGEFRGDLYYRLNEYPIEVPPLRDRREDIPILANFFLKEFCDLYEIEYLSISPEVMEELMNHSWPGNVRELKNIISRLAIQSPGPVIEQMELAELLDPRSKERLRERERLVAMPEPAPGVDAASVVPLEELERQEITKAYRVFNGNVDRAALTLGISRATLYRKLKKYGLQ